MRRYFKKYFSLLAGVLSNVPLSKLSKSLWYIARHMPQILLNKVNKIKQSFLLPKMIFKRYVVPIILWGQVFSLPLLLAQETIAPRMMVIHPQRIISECAASIDVHAQMETIRQQHLQELTADEQKLRQDQQDLNTLQHSLNTPTQTKTKTTALQQKNTDLLTKKENLFRKNVERIQRKTDIRKKQFNKAFTDAMDTIKTQYRQCLEQYVQQHHIDVVLDSESIIYNAPYLEKTTEILALLNTLLPKVSVHIPSEQDVLEREKHER